MDRTVRTIRLATAEDQPYWDRVVHHPLQSWAWGEFRSAMGVDVVRLVRLERGVITQGWQLTFHPLPGIGKTVAYLARSPLPTADLLDELAKLGQRKRTIYIQLEPDAAFTAEVHANLPHSKRFIPSHHALFTPYTFVLDLKKSETELLQLMHPKTRYNIRVAQKHGVQVQEDTSSRAFTDYLRLSEETTRRQGFYAHNRRYHQTMWRILADAGIATMFTATYQGQTLAAWIIFRWEKTVYYPYGASSRAHRQTMAPTLLLWEIARWAKNRGCTAFDLWGALGPEPDPHDPWFGFHRFKEGFRPDLIRTIGSYDYVLQPWLYRGFTIADRLRWYYLHLMRRLG